MKLKRRNIILITVLALLLLCTAAGWGFLSKVYPAQEAAAEAIAGSDAVAVELREDVTLFLPADPQAGLIFYPGARVEYTAYAPLMSALAEEGVLCALIEMPMNLAFLDIHAADDIRSEFDSLDTWYIGGHSLGGYCAASHAAQSQAYTGLLMLAAYSDEDLTGSGMSVLSIYGSEDGLLTKENYNDCFPNLPANTVELVIEGGNHAQFGDYGVQDQDGIPTISAEEQIAQTAAAVFAWMGITTDPMDKFIEELTVEEKVGQLFLAGCSPRKAQYHLNKYKLGGFVLFSDNFASETPYSMRAILADYQAASTIPLLLAVDEEGGIVTRISHHTAFRSEKLPASHSCYDRGGMEAALANEEEKCALLQSLGLNVNLGPVCDVTTNPNAFMYPRSLGQDGQTTAAFIAQTLPIMDAYGIGSALKHFPGYGNNIDTHVGIAVDSRSLAELEANDLLPFQAGIEAGCDAVMISHTVVQALDTALPASLSPAVCSYLRENMGYEGVIMTDDLAMYAITSVYGKGEAAVLAILAGVDLLCSTDFEPQYTAVLDAVNSGRIPMETLDAAVRNILEWKIDLGLLTLT